MAGRGALLPLALCLALLPGCDWLLGPALGGGSSGPSSDEAAAEANVRSAIPAIESYYVESGSYAGATVARLREYDDGIADVRVVVDPGGQSYCVESTVGTVTASRPGPAGDLRPGGC